MTVHTQTQTQKATQTHTYIYTDTQPKRQISQTVQLRLVQSISLTNYRCIRPYL